MASFRMYEDPALAAAARPAMHRSGPPHPPHRAHPPLSVWLVKRWHPVLRPSLIWFSHTGGARAMGDITNQKASGGDSSAQPWSKQMAEKLMSKKSSAEKALPVNPKPETLNPKP